MDENKKTIAILDDNKSITKIFKFMFERKGFNTIIYNNSKTFIESLSDIHFDALILDLMMPDYSGEEILEQLDEMNRLKSTNVLIHSAKSFPGKVKEKYHNYKIRTVRKPSKFSTVLKNIEELISEEN